MILKSAQFHGGNSLGLPLFWRALGRESVQRPSYCFNGTRRPHGHLLWQVTLSGCGRVDYGDKKGVPLPSGSSFLAKLPSEHVYYFDPVDEHWDFAWIMLDGPALPVLVESLHFDSVYPFERDNNASLRSKLLALVDLYAGRDADPWQNVQEACELLIGLVKEGRAPQRSGEAASQSASDSQLLAPIIKNPALSIDKQGWASESGQSRYQLYRKVKRSTGQSPKDIRNQQRVKEAIRYLMRPGIGIRDVATLAGFSNQAYFCRFFKKETGFTPSQWRQQFA